MFIRAAPPWHSMHSQGEQNGRVRLLLSALGFEKGWELCDGKWPVHGLGFPREFGLGEQLITAEPGSQISLRVLLRNNRREAWSLIAGDASVAVGSA